MRAQGRPVKVSFPVEKRNYTQMMQEHTVSGAGADADHCGCGHKPATKMAISKLSSFMTHTAADVMVAKFTSLLEQGQLQRNKAISVL